VSSGGSHLRHLPFGTGVASGAHSSPNQNVSFKNNRHRRLTVAALIHPNFSDEGKYRTPIQKELCKGFENLQVKYATYPNISKFLQGRFDPHSLIPKLPVSSIKPQSRRLIAHFVLHRVDN
jgi:hypothetical protein